MKTFLDELVQASHLKEFIDQKKTKAKEDKVISNPRFYRDREKTDDALVEDFPLGTIVFAPEVNSLPASVRVAK